MRGSKIISKVQAGPLLHEGNKYFTGSISIGVDCGVTGNLYVEGTQSTSGEIYTASDVNAASYQVSGTPGVSGGFTTMDGKTVTVTNGIIMSIVS